MINEISAEARALFAELDDMNVRRLIIENQLRDLRSQYRAETGAFINDMVRFKNAVHNIKVAA